MEIRGERITLRPLAITDLDDCARWASDSEVTKHVTGRTFTYEEEIEWIHAVLQNPNEIIFIILNENNKSIGSCGIHLIPKKETHRNEPGIEIGIMIGEKDEWGKGYGSETMRILADYVHETFEVDRVWLTVDTVHKAAIRAYEKAGFKIVREIHDSEEREHAQHQFMMEKLFNR